MVDINGRAVGFQRELDDIDGTDDTGAKSAGTDAKKRFRLSLNRHLLPKRLNLRKSIISKTADRRMPIWETRGCPPFSEVAEAAAFVAGTRQRRVPEMPPAPRGKP